MKRGEHGQIGGSVFEHLIKVPDLEMVAHADEQGALRNAALGSHPGRDRDAALAVELGRRDEAKGAALGGVVRLRVGVALPFALAPMAFGYAGAVVHDHAWRLVVQPNEEVIVRCSRLDRDAEGIVKRHVAANADARQRTADEEIVHYVLSTESRNDELWFRDLSGCPLAGNH